MTSLESGTDHAALAAFVRIAGRDCWGKRVSALGVMARQGQFTGRAAQQRHAAELMLSRLSGPEALARAGTPEKRARAMAEFSIDNIAQRYCALYVSEAAKAGSPNVAAGWR